jgi:hypothetical protein
MPDFISIDSQLTPAIGCNVRLPREDMAAHKQAFTNDNRFWRTEGPLTFYSLQPLSIFLPIAPHMLS